MGKLTIRNHDLFRDGLSGGYTHKETIADGITSDFIIIPPTGRGTTNGSVLIICGAGTGKIQITIDSDEDIVEGNATWLDWDKGEVTGTVIDAFASAISGVRGVSVSGEITFKILI